MYGGVALAEVANEERAAENAERGGRDCESPRCVELAGRGGGDGVDAVDGETPVADAVGAEPADEAETHAILAASVHAHLGVRDVQGEGAAEVRYVEGRVARRNGRVDKAARDGRRRKRAVKNVDVVVGKVSGIETIAGRRSARADGETRPDVARHRGDDLRRTTLRAVRSEE